MCDGRRRVLLGTESVASLFAATAALSSLQLRCRPRPPSSRHRPHVTHEETGAETYPRPRGRGFTGPAPPGTPELGRAGGPCGRLVGARRRLLSATAEVGLGASIPVGASGPSRGREAHGLLGEVRASGRRGCHVRGEEGEGGELSRASQTRGLRRDAKDRDLALDFSVCPRRDGERLQREVP